MQGYTNWIVTSVAKWLNREVEPKRGYLSNAAKICKIVKPADVLLIEGSTRVSRIIKVITHSHWSHVALCLGSLNDMTDEKSIKMIRKYYKGPADIHLLLESSLGKGTIISPITNYASDHVRICRPSSLTKDDAGKVVQFAVKRLGKSYNVRHIMDLARLLFPWRIFPRRWSSSLFSHNALKPTEEICSYIIARAFMSVDYPILPLINTKEQSFELTKRNPKLFTPSDFDCSPFFDIIKYPIVGSPGKLNYHNLKWKKGERHDT